MDAAPYMLIHGYLQVDVQKSVSRTTEREKKGNSTSTNRLFVNLRM